MFGKLMPPNGAMSHQSGREKKEKKTIIASFSVVLSCALFFATTCDKPRGGGDATGSDRPFGRSASGPRPWRTRDPPGRSSSWPCLERPPPDAPPAAPAGLPERARRLAGIPISHLCAEADGTYLVIEAGLESYYNTKNFSGELVRMLQTAGRLTVTRRVPIALAPANASETSPGRLATLGRWPDSFVSGGVWEVSTAAAALGAPSQEPVLQLTDEHGNALLASGRMAVPVLGLVVSITKAPAEPAAVASAITIGFSGVTSLMLRDCGVLRGGLRGGRVAADVLQ